MKENKTIVAFGETMTDKRFLEISAEKKAENKRVKDKATRRRYKLHALIKHFTKIKARSKEIHLTQEVYDSAAEDQKSALHELRDKFKYNLQFSLI